MTQAKRGGESANRIPVSRRTHVGRSRRRNEDAVLALCWPAPSGAHPAAAVAVADGMGGTEGGEVASRIAIDTLTEILMARWGEGRLVSADDWLDSYRAVFARATSRMRDCADGDAGLRAMGTTMTCLAVHAGRLLFAHLGDSRAYLYRDRELRRLTTDHNAAQELATEGRISPDDVQTHRSRNVLTRWLAPDSTGLDAEFGILDARAGDLVMVCSDGLHAMIPDSEVEAILRSSSHVDQAALDALADALIASANDAGGRDNISVALGYLTMADRPEPL